MIAQLHDWLLLNRPLIFFVYGQVFFVMGIAIVLQSRRYSRLALARSLPWLAAFGVTHAFNEWADLFIPIQSPSSPEPIIQLLRAAQLILLAVSFACLMQFGVELLRPLPDRFRWVRFMPIGILILWLIGPFWIGLQLMDNFTVWQATADALARYFIGLPAGALAAYGLWQHSRLRIAPLNLPRIYHTLRIAGLALLAYAVVGGLIVPPAPFFPANTFNVVWVADTFVIPTQVWRSIAATVIAIAMIRALEVFEVETDRMIEQMEQAQIVAIEREHIGRDLHDGAIQRVYAAGLLAESLRKKTDGVVGDGLDRLLLTLNEAITDLRHFLSDLRAPEAAADLAVVLSAVIDEAGRATDADIRWQPAALVALPPDRITHIASFTREALSNAVRHSQANVIEVQAHCADAHLSFTIHDNGRGLDPDARAGYGLRNMRDRARLLGGELTIDSVRGKGTTISLSVPLEREG
ncbi:Sensor histidine kinase LiaS [Thermoflexales bacterium]|nr:Sensor histidine kinase LiaS [Thermoflexales bacterium]